MRLWFLSILFLCPLVAVAQPSNPGLPTALMPEAVVMHKAYVLEYSEEHEQARWTAHMLTRQRVEGTEKRDPNFYEDPMVESGSANHEDYRHSGFSRGHLVPAGDMKWDTTAMRESNYYSNMTPQLADLNNGGWNRVENKVRQWAHEYDTLYIFTGPVLRKGLPTIGANKVSVPEYFWKVVYCPSKGQAIGFILPNRRCDEDIKTFAVTIDEVERQTGINFFHQLPQKIEKQLESTLCLQCWKW